MRVGVPTLLQGACGNTRTRRLNTVTVNKRSEEVTVGFFVFYFQISVLVFGLAETNKTPSAIVNHQLSRLKTEE